jgi:hypothetical protein
MRPGLFAGATALALARVLAGATVVARAAIALSLAGILAFAIVLCRGRVLGLVGGAGIFVGSISPGSESASIEASHGGGGNKQTGGTIHDITVFGCLRLRPKGGFMQPNVVTR